MAPSNKSPTDFREEDLQLLLDFVINNSHFEINGYLFRQERGVAMGSPAAPPLCNLVATVEDYFWHQTMSSLRFQMPDFGVLWHERYVDNRFILLRAAALEFYRPPVLLETQNDTKVFGYMCDSASRTIAHSYQIIRLRSKVFGAPTTSFSPTPRGHPDRGSLRVERNPYWP